MMRRVSAQWRSSVEAVLCGLKLAAGDAVTKLGSLVSKGMIAFWSSRGQMAALIINDKMTLIPTMGDSIRIAARRPDLEESVEMESGARYSSGQ